MARVRGPDGFPTKDLLCVIFWWGGDSSSNRWGVGPTHRAFGARGEPGRLPKGLAGLVGGGRPVHDRGRNALMPTRLTAPTMPGIATLRANQNATIDATITAISEVRDVTTSRGPSQVADATLQDETGTITLTLWGDDTKKYSVGQKVRITDGWVKDFRGKLQVSMGRTGTISIQS